MTRGVVVALMLLAILPASAVAAPPAVTTKAATETWGASSNLHGLVNPTSLATTYWFEYGLTVAYGSKTAATSAGSGFLPVEQSERITGLSPSAFYHYRMVAKNASGTTNGSNGIFFTSPSAVTEKATNVYARDATLDGTINPEGIKTTYWFEYGPTTSYGSKTSESTLGGGTTPTKVSAALSGISAGTTYHFRMAMSNAYGTQKGADNNFSTLSAGWSYQSTLNPGGELASNRLDGVSCVSGSECIAVGETSGDLMAQSWSGSEWSLMSMPEAGTSFNNNVGVSCTTFTSCTAVGFYWNTGAKADKTLAERWNGSEWLVQETPNPAGSVESKFESVSCASSSACMAVGTYVDSEVKGHPLSASWNGTEWKLQEVPTPVGTSANYLHGVSCTASNACTAVGYSDGKILAERWNGAEWKIQTTPATSGSLEDVSCASAACMAVGTNTGTTSALAVVWNGTEWKASEVLTPGGATKAILDDVSCASASVCFAVGWYENAASSYQFAEGWNGTSWQIHPIPPPPFAISSSLAGISCVSPSLCEAVGAYKSGTVRAFAERYE